MRTINLIFCIALLTNGLCARDSKGETAKSDKQKGWTIFPVISYSSETALELGVLGNFYRPLKGATKSSYVEYFFAASTKGHIDGEVSLDMHFPDSLNHLKTEIRFLKYPQNFYGLGNGSMESAEEAFSVIGGECNLNWLHHSGRNLFLGVLLKSRFAKTSGYVSDKLLGSGAIDGTEKWFIWGVGPSLLYDRRDNEITTREGVYFNSAVSIFARALGSDYSFVQTTIDGRYFIPLPYMQALGFQIVGSFTNGTVPFQYLPRLYDDELGGLRGYYSERYRAKNMIVGQIEYRKHLFWRLSGALFAGAGDVFNTVTDLNAERLKIAGGVGLRIRIGADGSKLTLDYARNRDGGGAFYFGFGDYF